MRIDAHGLEILTRQECLALLSTAPLGRVVFTDRALPAIQPVGFLLDGEDVVIRTAPGSKLGLAARSAIVAFEADDFDPGSHAGWSVTVVGHAGPVEDPAEVARLSALPVPVLAPGPLDRIIRIRGTQISGRRIPAYQSQAA